VLKPGSRAPVLELARDLEHSALAFTQCTLHVALSLIHLVVEIIQLFAQLGYLLD
jgi:hypothetical protein